MKQLAVFIFSFFIALGPANADIVRLGDGGDAPFKGLQKEKQDKIEDGAFNKFENLYINDGNIEVVKGRDQLLSTALTDPTVNGLFYYETPSVKGESYNVETLLACDGTDGSTTFTDDSLLELSFSAEGDAQIDTAQSKFGGASCLFDGTGDGLSHTDLNTDKNYLIGSGAATASFWVRFNTDPGTGTVDFINRYLNSSNNWRLYLSNNNLTYDIVNGGSTTVNISNAWNPAASTWYHVEFVKSGTSYYMFIDGTQIGTTQNSASTDVETGNFTVSIGINGDLSSNPLDGWMDDIRWDKGAAFHTANFTAPTTAYVVESDTATQKIVLADVDQVVTYDLDWTNRTEIISGIGDDDWDFTQVATALYLNSQANGAYKWTGTGSASSLANPPDHKLVEEYKGVIFSADGGDLRYSNSVGEDETDNETWSASNYIEIGYNNHSATGLHKSHNSLLIFTGGSIQELTGFGSTFELKNISFSLGSVNDQVIETDESGSIIFFSGASGVWKLQLGDALSDTTNSIELDQRFSRLEEISRELENVFRGDDDDITLSISDYVNAHAYYDLENSLYFLYIDEHCFIYDNENQTWSYMPGTEMTGSLYVNSTIDPTDNKGHIVDNLGYAYENWIGYNNGPESGTVTGNPTSTTSTTLTDTGATFYTTNDGLTGMWVYVDNDNGEWRQISSNTGTVLTVSEAWTTNPIVSDDYYIGYIRTQALSKQYNFVKLPERQQLKSAWVIASEPPSSQEVDVLFYQNKETFAINASTIDLNDSALNKLSIPMGGNGIIGSWFQMELISFVYDTDDTIDAPVDYINYIWDLESRKER